MERNHNLDLKAKYDNLLKRLIPRFAQRGKRLWTCSKNQKLETWILSAQTKYSNETPVNSVEQLIETVDLSSDETEASTPAAANSDMYQANRFQSLHRKSNFEFKKPSAFVYISDEDDSPQNFMRESVLSSTFIQQKKNAASSPVTSERKSQSQLSVSVPEVAPVNSLRDRQQSRKCLQEDAISSIVKLYGEKQKEKDSQILDAAQSWVERRFVLINRNKTSFQCLQSFEWNSRSRKAAAAKSPRNSFVASTICHLRWGRRSRRRIPTANRTTASDCTVWTSGTARRSE